MTSERDFDRLARAWLELGPDEAPDGVVAAVLQAADTVPQARRRVAWPTWRSFSMNRHFLAAGAVAILVILIGGGILIDRRNEPAIGGPSAAPTFAPSSSVAASPSPLASTTAIVLQRVPTDITCADSAIDYDIATIRIDPAADPAVWVITRTGKRLAVSWSAGFSASGEPGPLIRGPRGEAMAGDQTVIDIKHWQSYAPWNQYYLCPTPDKLYVLERPPG